MASERIDDIVSQQAIEQLIALGQQLQAVKEQMNDLIVDVAKFSAELNNVGSVREMGTAVNNLNTATNNLNSANNSRLALEREIKASGEAMAKQVRDETNHFERLSAVMETHMKTQGQTAKEIAKLELEIKKNKDAIKALGKEYDEKQISLQEYQSKLAELLIKQEEYKHSLSEERQAFKAINKDLQSAEGSYDQLNARLGQLRDKWRQLSEEERENADVGGVLKTEINNLDEMLKGMDASVGNNQRNVGNYGLAVSNLGSALKGLKNPMNWTIAGLKGIGIQLTKLLAHPLVLVIAAIVAVVMKLVNAFKKNDEAMTELQSAFAAFKPILDIVNKGFQFLVGVITKVISLYGKLARAIVSIIPSMKEYADAEEDIVRSTDQLQESQRQYAIDHAKRDAEISKLRNQSLESEKYSVEQRRGFLQKAINLEKKDLQEKKANAQEEYRIAEKKALMEMGFTEMTTDAWNKLSDAQKDNLTQLKVAVINADKEYEDGIRRITSQMNNFDKQEKQTQEQKQREYAESAKERKKLEQDALKELEDLQLERIKNDQQREEETAKVNARRAIEALRERLRTETNLTKKAKDAINKQIVMLEENLQFTLLEIQNKYNEERLQRIRTWTQQREDLQMSMWAKTQENENLRFGVELARLDAEEQELLKKAKDDEEAKIAISNLYAAKRAEAEKRNEDNLKAIREKDYQELLKNMNLEFDVKASQLDADGANYKARLELQEEFWNEAERINKEAYDKGLISEEQYTINSNRLAAERIAAAKAEKTAKLQASQSIIGSIADIMLAGAEQIEDEKKRVKIEQAITMAKVLLTESLAIAQAVLTQTQGDPYSFIPRVIASVATITGTFITAISAITKAQNAYAEGTDYHRGGSAIVGEGTKNGHWQSEIVETPDGKRFLVDKPTYFSNMPVGTKVIPTEQYGSSVDLGATNSILERIASKGQVVVNVDDKITNYILTKNSRIRVLNSKFKYN